MSKKLYSFVLKKDNGTAPNPYWGICTMALCKPAIRKGANIDDWIIGTGSKTTRLSDGDKYDFSDSITFAMKVTKIMTFKEYDYYCKTQNPDKIPNWFSSEIKRRMGDCIYEYDEENEHPFQRKGIHDATKIDRDMSGKNVLLSDEFYYFGEEARPLPDHLRNIIKHNQGHLKIEDDTIIERFEEWISKFEKNKIYADPQLTYEFDSESRYNRY